jgi:hypothetical protein
MISSVLMSDSWTSWRNGYTNIHWFVCGVWAAPSDLETRYCDPSFWRSSSISSHKSCNYTLRSFFLTSFQIISNYLPVSKLRRQPVVQLRHYATSWKVTGSIFEEAIDIFNWTNPSSHTMALGSTQPVTEMSTRKLPGGKGRPARNPNNLTVICEPIVYRKCGTLDVSQPYGSPRLLTG